QLAGPLPYLMPGKGSPDQPCGILFPLPLDVVYTEDGMAHTLMLRLADPSRHSSRMPALAVSPVPARKEQAAGFLTEAGMKAYLNGKLSSEHSVVAWTKLFEEEYRIGVELSPAANSAVHGRLYAATHARPDARFRILAWTGLKSPVNDEAEKLDSLGALVIGGEQRMARLTRDFIVPPPLTPLCPDIPESSGPVVIKWSLATSGVFAHGWLPGWCRDSTALSRPEGRVCLKLAKGRAHLIAACLGKPVPFAGWDMVRGESKPTQFAVPAGSVYYFLCEDTATAREFAILLHWRPRSDSYGEKGFGHGFASHHPASPDILKLADSLFKSEK
ncbi:MAG: hypothetical protein EOP86_27770, partial [Verrucomicrobiaceae bacterium]